MIDQTVIEQIFDTAQILDVVQDFVSLKKRGANYLGLCPFHSEKTPSFNVSPSKNIYKCFGCSKGGNPVSFIMEHEHLSYTEALRYLARKYNIEIREKEATPEDIQRNNEIESLNVVNEYAGGFFAEQLHKTEEGQNIGLSYFHERGFRDDIIERFQLGYSPDRSDVLAQTAVKAGYKMEYLVKTGLVVSDDRGTFDRFRGRVMFPIHGLSGKIIAFGGRTLRTDKSIAKYLNSPESEVYHKSKILYGIYHAKKSIIEKEKCFLVEGYTDVISMHQAGIENVVASSGTSLTTDQIRLIKRFTNNITILYDGDPAGIKASIRGIDMILEEGMTVKVLLFPDNDDPDSFSRKHSSTEVLEFIAKNEVDFVLFKTRLLYDEAKSDPVKRATLITDIVRSIANIPDPILRSEYIKECASILNTDERVIYSQTNKERRAKAERKLKTQWEEPKEERAVEPARQIATGIETEHLEREIVRLMIQFGDHMLTFHNEEDKDFEISVASYIVMDMESDELTLVHPLYKQIFEECLYLIKTAKPVSYKHFVNHPEKEISECVVDMLSAAERYKESRLWKKNKMQSETEESRLMDIVTRTLMSFKEKTIKLELRILQNKLTEISADQEQIDSILERYMMLSGIKKTISKSLGERIII